MISAPALTVPRELDAALWRLFRDYIATGERKRRWSIEDSIPWSQGCRPLPSDVVAVLDSLYLAKAYARDVAAQVLPRVRALKGPAWFFITWGYEELKHGLALHDWLTRSGQRTEGEIAALEKTVAREEWTVPEDDPLGLLVHLLEREKTCWVCCRNLKDRVEPLPGSAALVRLLDLMLTDEHAHLMFLEEVVDLVGKTVPARYDRVAARPPHAVPLVANPFFVQGRNTEPGHD